MSTVMVYIEALDDDGELIDSVTAADNDPALESFVDYYLAQKAEVVEVRIEQAGCCID